MRLGFSYFAYRFYPARNYIRNEERHREINFYDWNGKNLLKNDSFCTNFVNSTPSNGILSFNGLDIILIMFMASGFILSNSSIYFCT
jgi:hypothetical protein